MVRHHGDRRPMIAAVHRRCRFAARLAVAGLVLACGAVRLAAQDSDSAAQSEPLNDIESRLADRYDRLELLAGRLAELSGSAQPRRAELLRQLIARGRERDVPGQFD